MEFLNVVDESDKVIGRVEREHAHRHFVRHRSGMVFLLNSRGEVLLQQRASDRETFPDCLDASVTFHIKYGEPCDEAAQREMFEEVGVVGKPEFIGKFSHRDRPENQIVWVWKHIHDGHVQIDPRESRKGFFLPWRKVDGLIESSRKTPWLRRGWELLKKHEKWEP
jgi:isopentenyldiphosphate isomerase